MACNECGGKFKSARSAPKPLQWEGKRYHPDCLRKMLATALQSTAPWISDHEDRTVHDLVQDVIGMSIQDPDPAPPPPNYEQMAKEVLKFSSSEHELTTPQKVLLAAALLWAEGLSSLRASDIPEAHSAIRKAYDAFIKIPQPTFDEEDEVRASDTLRSCYPTLEEVGGFAFNNYQEKRTLAGQSNILELWEKRSAFFPQDGWLKYRLSHLARLKTLIFEPAEAMLSEGILGLLGRLETDPIPRSGSARRSRSVPDINIHPEIHPEIDPKIKFSSTVGNALTAIMHSCASVRVTETKYDHELKYVWLLVDCLTSITLLSPKLLTGLHNESWWSTNLHSQVIEKLFVFSHFDMYGANATTSSSARRFTNLGNVKGAKKPDVMIADEKRELLFVDRKSTRLNSSHRNTSRMPSSA